MTQYVASTVKAVGIGVGSLSVIGYLALWGGQRQVWFPLVLVIGFLASFFVSSP